MKKALFIDRDGTIIQEPPIDFQVDSLDKLSFVPRAITALSRIVALGEYELVMASNQDGLGTESFPEPTFYGAHNKMKETLAGEGVIFDDELIDPSFPHQNSPNRKPGIGMFGKYMTGEYDLAASYVIGDRLTDVRLAANLGAQAILFQSSTTENSDAVLITDDWNRIYDFLRMESRSANVERRTNETDIKIHLDLDGNGAKSTISTGLNFFDHMLEQLPHHSGILLNISVTGDLEVDEHHTMEDTAIALGDVVLRALGSKRGIERYGFSLPMDECEATVLLDFGGRIDFLWDVEFHREKIGDTPTEMFEHFFKSFAESAKCNLHIKASGKNEHHKIEGIFKAFSRALKQAINRTGTTLPSSKGVL